MTWLASVEPLTKVSEKCYLFAYPDPASPLAKAMQRAGIWYNFLAGKTQIPSGPQFDGLSGVPWTIAYGHTGGVKRGDTCTQEQADAWLVANLQEAYSGVIGAVHVPLTDAQCAALVDFTYNLGIGNLRTSTLLRLLNAGDYSSAADQFLVWNKAGGQVLDGLVTRRKRERALFLTGVWV